MEKFKFEERLRRNDKHDAWLAELATPLWRIALAALYLSTGRCLPPEAKARGVFFGFCDEHGNRCPRDLATHVGWTVTPAPAPEVPGC